VSSTAESGSASQGLPASLARLLRERDQLFLLHEALAEVERARTLTDRLRILADAIGRLGYGRVETVGDYVRPDEARVVATISNSSFLSTNHLIVPIRPVDGAMVGTLVLGEPDVAELPTLARVRTVELFAQQVASIIQNARLYEESQRERRRGEALADIARAVNSSLRLADVMQLSLHHAVALLQTHGAALGLVRDDQIVVVAATGIAECLMGAPLPLNASVAGRAVREGRTIIANNANVDDAYAPTRIAAGIERTIMAPLFSSTETIGVLSVVNRETEFDDEDAAVLQRLADQVALAVTNARLYEEARASADRYQHASEDERRARDAVERSEARYSRLVESASDAIFTVDPHGALTAVNRSLERASGIGRAALLGTPFIALIDSRDQSAADQALAATFSGQRRRIELRYPAGDGEIRHCSLTLTPLMEAETVAGALGVVRDVTDEKRLAEQLMQQEKLAAVGELVSGVAHELNNPLASVMAFAQLLLAAPPDEIPDREAIEAINQESRRAAKIVSNLLTFARQHRPERTVADLNRVIDDTIELRRYSLRTAQVEVEARLDALLPVTWADPFQLQQVVLNLISNAEHALASWDGERKIVVTTDHDEHQIVICVADTGPGIAAEHLSRIFNPFFTTKPVGEGTGLGLSISDGIVREHGGRIRVESRLGCGATFTVELPVVPPPPIIGVSEHKMVSGSPT
jgi:two-component system NtrC family sensor kinase